MPPKIDGSAIDAVSRTLYARQSLANTDVFPVFVTTYGSLMIANPGLEIARGNISGVSFIHKFGKAPDFDSGDGFVTCWDGANDGNTNEMQYNYSATADIDSLSSSNNGDTQDIEVQGLTSTFLLTTQTITLTGQTRAALATKLIRVFRMKNVGTTDFAGQVYCYISTSPLTGGVPATTSTIRAQINASNNQTLMAVYTIPTSKTGYMYSWYVGVAGAIKTSAHVVHLVVRPTGQVFQLKNASSVIANGNSYLQHSYDIPEILPGKSDIEIRVNTDTNVAAVSAGFDIILVDD